MRAKGVANKQTKSIQIRVWTDEREAEIIQQLCGEEADQIDVSAVGLSFSQGQCVMTFTLRSDAEADTIVFSDEDGGMEEEKPKKHVTGLRKAPMQAPAAGTGGAVTEAAKGKVFSSWKGNLNG